MLHGLLCTILIELEEFSVKQQIQITENTSCIKVHDNKLATIKQKDINDKEYHFIITNT